MMKIEAFLRTLRSFGSASLLAFLCLALLFSFSPSRASANTNSEGPAQTATSIHDSLFQARMSLDDNPQAAKSAFEQAKALYSGSFAQTITQDAPELNTQILAGFVSSQNALEAKNETAFVVASANLWTDILASSYTVVEQALKQNNGEVAGLWLQVREFRHSTRFSRPNTNATLAVNGVIAHQVTSEDAILTVRADLFDTYQGQLNEALKAISTQDQKGFQINRAEKAALVNGYFEIFAHAYQEQRGEAALQALRQKLHTLTEAAISGNNLQAAIDDVTDSLHGFRAAPLSPEERARRAGQLIRFISLVPTEYERGVTNGVVHQQLEVQEAVTFRDGAEAAFSDLQNLLEERDTQKTQQVEQSLKQLNQKLQDALTGKQVVPAEEIRQASEQMTTMLKELIPQEWQQHSLEGDFDVISSMLDQMETAVAAGQYELAESARLEAYAVLESGPEARLRAFAQEKIQPIEDLFWYGQNEHKGLAYLISQKAPLKEIKATRVALEQELEQARTLIAGTGTPLTVGTNAAIIVFREGLEAVLILASLMGSLKRDAVRKFRRPLWVGALVSLFATGLTWVLAGSILNVLARYGETLEAIVSVIAIGVLLLITNWFFHKVYWTGWIANFHTKKGRLLGAEVGQWLGLALLGFTSIYREGFEVVLFLQALVLESGLLTVLAGVGVGLLGTLIIGLIVFALQFKLPYKKMLIVTGVMISAVLLIMVGNTAHVLQLVGWLPIHPISFIQIPYWLSLWLGLYATWEGVLLQIASAVFVIGSYVLAEHQQKRRGKVSKSEEAKSPVTVEAAK